MSRLTQILPRGLIVSCQALENEPLHSTFIMQKMALAALEGGAIGIRANGGKDIAAIKDQVPLPLIGIVKRDYPDSEIYITATLAEVAEVQQAGAEIVAFDATARPRPAGESLAQFIAQIRQKFPDLLLMADIATYSEAIVSAELGVDLLATTLCGYTAESQGTKLPALDLMKQIAAAELDTPFIAEGGIWSSEQLNAAFACGAYSCVMGTAITRPQEITRRIVSQMQISDPNA